MNNQRPEAFRGRRVLMLQGPVGPFFRRFSSDLQRAGARVYKVNFNGGDLVFYPSDSVSFRGRPQEWPAFFRACLDRWDIDTVLLFGDCRAYHVVAREIAAQRGIEVGVFEEGYVRPDYITLERHGVNGFSGLPRDPDFYRKHPVDVPPTRPVGRFFWQAAKWAMLYFFVSNVTAPYFRHYKHHRPLHILDGLFWIRSLWRKHVHALRERKVLPFLTGPASKQFYLVPLQVHNDSQIRVHSRYDTMTNFIDLIMHSFTRHAPAHRHLVIKHHPLDRGYFDYLKCIREMARDYGIEARVHYIHDQHLPTLFDHACGVVVANSTVGLSAIHHGLPVSACPSAIYDMPGLTWRNGLDAFWDGCDTFRPDPVLYQHYRGYVIKHTQINGSFYQPLAVPGSRAGLIYNGRFTVARPLHLVATHGRTVRMPLFGAPEPSRPAEVFHERVG